MSANYQRKLFAIAPGFRQDKDEVWIDYLSLEEQTYLRRCREKFIIMKDRLDELKLRQKDQKDPTSQDFLALGKRMESDTLALNNFINSILLVKLPHLKRKAEKAREELIERDFNTGGQETDASDIFGSQFASLSKSYDAFLPSHLLPAQEPPPPASPKPTTSGQTVTSEPTTSAESAIPKPSTTAETATPSPLREKVKTITRDTYLDGVHSENIAIMNAMRPLVDKYDCRDRVLAALKKIRYRDHWLDILESIKTSFPLQGSSTNEDMAPSTSESTGGQQQQQQGLEPGRGNPDVRNGMADSLQESQYKVQQSGDNDYANKNIQPPSENGCNTDNGRTDQKAIAISDTLIELDTEKRTEPTEAAVVEAPVNDIPTQTCQTPAASQVKVDDARPNSSSAPVAEHSANPTPAIAVPVNTSAPNKSKDVKVAAPEKKKEDDKLGIYKALAIKLKKELVKSRDELSKLKDLYKNEVSQLREQLTTLEKTLESERITSTNTNATLEATVKNLRNQLEAAEQDMQCLQVEYDNYKTRATKILQQNQPLQSSTSKFTFEEERCKQLKSLSEEQKGQIKDLRVQVDTLTERNKFLESELSLLNQKLGETTAHVEQYQSIEEHRDRLASENKALKLALEQYKNRGIQSQGRTEKRKAKIPLSLNCSGGGGEPSLGTVQSSGPAGTHQDQDLSNETKQPTSTIDQPDCEQDSQGVPQVSPSGSFKDDNQTNSSSSFDSSAYGYVHIKPTPFEIISRSSVLEDAQNQIDNLTKAYMDSESTNSLLTEQVRALKEEIRRIQRGNERMELANNLEYLKNVIFKFLSLDQSQVEQKQRLIPVLSTILKLSPDETNKLNSLALVERPSMTSSFFKL